MTTRRELLKRAVAAPTAAWWMGSAGAADEPKFSGTLYFGGLIRTGLGVGDFQIGLVTLDLKGGTWSVQNGGGLFQRLSPDRKWVTSVTNWRNPDRVTIWLGDAAGVEGREIVKD